MAKEYPAISLNVSPTVDFDKISQNIKKHLTEWNPKKHQKVLESIQLFLHYLYPSDHFIARYGLTGYKKINSREFDSITNKLFPTVKRILVDPDYQVIEVNESYQAGIYSKGYRMQLNFHIHTLPSKVVIIESIISLNYLKKFNVQPLLHDKKEEEPFKYLQKSYKPEIIALSPRNKIYINSLEEALLKKTKKLKKQLKIDEIIKLIYKKINRLKKLSKEIENGNYNSKISKSNKRLYSTMTYCEKEIRSNLMINNNNNLVEIDLKNSHLYCLASILNKEFISGHKPFSLKKIKKEYFNSLNHNLNTTSYLRKLINEKLKYDKTIDLGSYKDSLIIYMCSLFSKPDVVDFKSMSFGEGIYEFLNEQLLNGEKDRSYVKDQIMKFLNLKSYRDGYLLISKLDRTYPSIRDIIDIFNFHTGLGKGKNLSTLLQCVEAFLLLEVGVREVSVKMPDIDFFTVHDAIIVEPQHGEAVKEILERSISQVTGIPLVLDIKPIQDPICNIQALADKTFRSIEKRYYKNLKKERNAMAESGI